MCLDDFKIIGDDAIWVVENGVHKATRSRGGNLILRSPYIRTNGCLRHGNTAMLARAAVPDPLRQLIIGNTRVPGVNDDAPVDRNLKPYSRSPGCEEGGTLGPDAPNHNHVHINIK